jgi:hypothetical protein
VLGGLVDRVFSVAGAMLFFQAPFFMTQYQHQLYGHVSELQSQIQTMTKAAALTGKTLQQYVAKFLASGDTDFTSQGRIIHGIIERYQELNTSYNALQEASIYTKPYFFVKYYDWNIGISTWHSFTAGFSFTTESLVYTAAGLLFGLVFYRMLRAFCRVPIAILRRVRS